MNDVMKLCDMVRETAYAIHTYHAHGHLEKVYENALVHRLQKEGLKVQQQCPLKVYDEDGTEIGDYFADLIVEDCLVVELKATKVIADEHRAQLIGYLQAAGIEHGLLINFGSYRFQIKKYALTAPEKNRSGRMAGFLILLALSFAFSVFFCG